MPKFLIIADDLTGAADCGGVFGESGFECVVLLAGPAETDAAPAGEQAAEVVCIDAGTRCLPAADAGDAVARIVRAFAKAAPHGDACLVFKKVDSTLRGNVAAELAAALRARRGGNPGASRSALLFAPAFPSCGRTTVNGRQFVWGKALRDSDVWSEPGRGAPEHISDIFGEAGISAGLLGLAQVRGPADGLKSAMRKMALDVDAIICDAETDADLEAIARAGAGLEERPVWAGSAGLARQLARLEMPRRAPQGSAQGMGVHGPALFAVGSAALASRGQVAALASSDIATFPLSPSDFPSNAPSISARIGERLQRGDDVLVHFDAGGSWPPEVCGELTLWLARLLAPCAPYAGALFACGGDTARAILDAWRVHSFRLLGEVEPGLPYAQARCAGRELFILTKAGGFGTRDTLLRCRKFIHSGPACKPTHT